MQDCLYIDIDTLYHFNIIINHIYIYQLVRFKYRDQIYYITIQSNKSIDLLFNMIYITKDNTSLNQNSIDSSFLKNTESIREEETLEEEEEEVTKLQRLSEEIKLHHKNRSIFRRPSLFVISILVFLFGFSEMLYLTPFITLTINKICHGVHAGSCDSKEVQMYMSQIGSTTLIYSGVISTLMGGKWGQWSDHYGRVKIFGYMGLIRVIGNLLHLLTLSSYVPFNKWLIILSATINSTSGGMFAFFGNVNSYLNDIVEPEDRIFSISFVTSLMQITTGIGPLMGSLLVNWYNGNDSIPIYIAIGTGILFTVLCFTVVVEPRHHMWLEYTRERFTLKQMELYQEFNNEIIGSSSTLWFKVQRYGKYHLTKLADLLAPLKQLWLEDKPSSMKWNVLLLVTIDILFGSVIMGIMPSFLLFCTYKYHWKSVELGYFISFCGIMNGITLFLSSHYGINLMKNVIETSSNNVDKLDKFSIGISLIFLTFSNIFMIRFSNYSKIIIVFVILRSLSKICSPVTEAAIMKYYKKTGKNTGQVFGAIALLNSLSMLIVPPILLRIYGFTVGVEPELFLYFPLVCCLIALISCHFLNINNAIENPNFTRSSTPLYGTES